MIINYGNITLGDNVELASNLNMIGGGNFIVNDTEKLIPFMSTYSFDYVFNDTNLTGKTTNANIIFNNCNGTDINNNQNLTVNNCSLLGRTSNSGKLIINNSIINGTLNNNNNLTVDNGIINAQVTNNANMTILSGVINNTISNTGTVIIGDNVIFGENTNLAGSGNYVSNDSQKLIPYLETYNGNITFENMTLNGKTNNGNLTIVNCNITNIKNNGNMTIINSTLNGTSNSNNYYYNMMIINSTVYQISNTGNLTIINSTVQYRLDNDRNLTLENVIVDGDFTNYNTLISSVNCTYNKKITSYASNKNMLFEGGVINCSVEIGSNGNITFDDNVVFGEKTKLNKNYGTGIFIINDTSKIARFVDVFDGIYNLSDMDISGKSNNGNLTTYNCTFTSFTNNGNMAIMTGLVNGTLNNNGNVTFTDDVTFGENTQLNGNGNYTINDYDKILSYLQVYNGNFTIENKTLSQTKTNKANLTLINCNISTIGNSGNLTLNNTNFYSVSNTGNVYIDNTIINQTINNNNGNVSFGENVTFGENTQLKGNGNYISSNPDMINYIQSYRGNIIIENNNLRNIPNYGNVTVINGTVDTYVNDANLTIIDSVINGNLTNKGNLIIINSTADIITGDGNNVNITFINSTCNKLVNQGKPQHNYQVCNTSTVIRDSNFNNGYINLNGNTTILNCEFIETRPYIIGFVEITNCSFVNNSQEDHDQYSGSSPCGGALILHGSDNSIIRDSKFINNHVLSESTWTTFVSASGGAIYLEGCHNLTIQNNSFINNSATGRPGIKMHWNDSTYYMEPTYDNGCGGAIAITSTSNNISIINNEFKDNRANYYGADIFVQNTNDNITITNNSFENSNAHETIFFNETVVNYLADTNSSLGPNDIEIIDRPINKTITDNIYNNCSIQAKEFNITYTKGDNTNEVTITGNLELKYSTYYDADILNNIRYSFNINNKTINTTTLSLTFTPTENMTKVYVTTPTILNRSNILVIKDTTESNIIITPENIEDYLLDGELIGINDDTNITFQGQFNDLEEIYISNNNLIIDGTDASFTNTYFTLDADNITIRNMNINNTDISEYTINSYGDNNIITNNTISQYNNEGKTATIYNIGDNTLITDNTLSVAGPALSIEYSEIDLVANTQAILTNNADNNTISDNIISLTNSTPADDSWFSTIEAITTPGATNTLITNNQVNVTGARFNYGINLLGNVKNNNITQNNITVTGHRYTDGIQLGNNAQNNLIANNNIQLTCLNTTEADEAAISYGIIVTSQGGAISNNNTIRENNININGIVNYGMEIYTSTNTDIISNNITLNGAKSMGIGYAHSPNSTVANNTITTNDNSNLKINSVTEEIQPANTGIKIQQNSDNITIENNIIQTNDISQKDKTIDTEDLNTVIINNQLQSSSGFGADTIKTTQTDTVIENNTDIIKETTIKVDTTTFTVGETATITASIYYGEDVLTNLSKGKVSFKVNGKTLKDDNGKVIYAKVVNGTATIEDFVVPESWAKEGTTIQAVYSGSSDVGKLSSKKEEININKEETSITTSDITATAGETITLTATITDNNKVINTGKVVFKINGKTVKDANGKVIYAKVVNNQVSVEYTLPADMKAKDYNITATFISSDYERLEDTKTLTITA